METDWEGNIVGVFKGYAGGRVYPLSNGSRWRQEDRTSEYVYREEPKAKLIWDQSTGRMFLDVEGTSATVLVVTERSVSGLNAGGF